MLPIRWDPLRELSTLHREMDELFRKSLGSFGHEREPAVEGGRWMTPLVDTFVKGNTFHIKAELPGVSKDDIDVRVDGNVLTLKGEREEEKETKEEDYQLRETRYGSFLRRLNLPEGAKTENVHASFDNGVLEIEIPFEDKDVRGRKILIEGPEASKEKKKIH